ncbi:MAG: hypothetical protein IT324_18365 [Anaerolineae bacterium]|nr:hypothetical protein [Anaerolineae bacterium]
MSVIEILGHINENGQLEFDLPDNLPAGDVRITIEPFDAEDETADEALWEQQFASSPETLDFLAREAREEFYSGTVDSE